MLAFAVFLIFSCQKNEGAKTSRDAIAEENGIPGIAMSTESHGYVLRVNAAFYTLENDTGSETDRTKWDDSMALGEKVQVGKPRRVTFAGDKKAYDFLEIRRDNGKDGLAWASQIARGGSLAVITDEKANLYKSAKSIDVTDAVLPRKTVAVCFPDTERGGSVAIKAYDPETQITRQNFIRTAAISLEESDIQSSILLQTALPLKNEGTEKVRRDALLEAALLDYPNSAFSADIQALANPNTAVLIKTEPASHSFMSVNDNDVNVRDLPDPVAGRVIGQLNEDDEVSVSEQTVATSTNWGTKRPLVPYNRTA
jgi:hypothetical protein